MDADRFDSLTRSLMTTGSRRRVLAAISGALGLPLGAFSLAETEAKKSCPPCKKRKRGKCKKKKPNGTACPRGTCQGGRCVAAPPDPNACTANACDSPDLFASCGPAGSGCGCFNSGSASAPAGPGRCFRPPILNVTCSAGECPSGFECVATCGFALCLEPCV